MTPPPVYKQYQGGGLVHEITATKKKEIDMTPVEQLHEQFGYKQALIDLIEGIDDKDILAYLFTFSRLYIDTYYHPENYIKPERS